MKNTALEYNLALHSTKHLWTSKKSRKTSKKPQKRRLSDRKVFEKHYFKSRTREASGWGGPSAVGDAGERGASLESMSCALTCGPCETGQNHSADMCGSHAGFPATELGGGGRQWLALLLRWAVSPHVPLKLVFQRNTPQLFSFSLLFRKFS